jgi:hypothetical protein
MRYSMLQQLDNVVFSTTVFRAHAGGGQARLRPRMSAAHICLPASAIGHDHRHRCFGQPHAHAPTGHPSCADVHAVLYLAAAERDVLAFAALAVYAKALKQLRAVWLHTPRPRLAHAHASCPCVLASPCNVRWAHRRRSSLGMRARVRGMPQCVRRCPGWGRSLRRWRSGSLTLSPRSQSARDCCLHLAHRSISRSRWRQRQCLASIAC